MGICLVAALWSGCYKATPPEEAVEPTTNEDARIYEALCRHWAECRPDRLAFFPGSDVARCIAFYRYFYEASEWPSGIEDSAKCRQAIEGASCDSLFSKVTPEPAGVLLLSSALRQMGGLGNDEADGVWLSLLPGCESASEDLSNDPPAALGEACLGLTRGVTPTSTAGYRRPTPLLGTTFAGSAKRRPVSASRVTRQ